MCKRALNRVLGGLARVLPSSLRERGVSDGAYVGSLLWLLGASGGVKSDAEVSMFRLPPGVRRSTGGFSTSGPRISIGPDERVS